MMRWTGPLSCAACGEGFHERFKQPLSDGSCDKCGCREFRRRADDNEVAVRARMAEYRAKTAPILPYYEERGLVARVDGLGTIADVAAAIDGILDAPS